ncbi:hypothetical protein TPHA_0F02690 [Tetrapisispora phaffii CBS 4417]|uniref:WH1 domain-containing protein n=1 Tax=Tetrapisispora phaffii (strain ATCC 24235 / CBS 4417 / NBRC 1672 / NRRL Y-8282 / UCD 70-5) TaxID=1071381 RepID=G8BUG3_TETPH|nr:hypothetical protein TPHA_0F02690 [Tetrapisispora phaffii CBS 4417]CCE63749.1 hypothetical protein TPHA_0F02690 [Tetrapisispora phaffii CBS 4417]
MGLLTSQDKEVIKRALPKASNKIIDVAIARLYIAYPNPNEWQYTGLSGAVVLVDDIVGDTFFLKLVDIYGHRGVIWDQEIYVNFEYYQDRTFLHTFELEECYAGLLFEDVSEAQHFLKRVQRREKYGSKKTVNNKNAIAQTKKINDANKNVVVQGPRGEAMISDQRQRYNYDESNIIPTTKSKAPPPPPPSAATPDTYDNTSESDNEGKFYSVPDSPTSHAASPPSVDSTPAAAHPVHNVPPMPTHFLPTNNPPPTFPTTVVPSPPAGAPPPMSPPPMSPPPMSPPPISPPAADLQKTPFPIPQPTASQVPAPQQLPGQPSTQQFPRQQQFQQQSRPVPQLPNRNARSVPPPPGSANAQMNGARIPPPAPQSRRGPAPPPPPHRQNNAPIPASGFRPTPQPPSSRRGPAPPPPPRKGSRPVPQVSTLPPRSPPAQAMSPPITSFTQPVQQPQPPSREYLAYAQQVPEMPMTTFGVPQSTPSPAMPTQQAYPAAVPAPPPPPIMPTQQAYPTAVSAPPPPPAMPTQQAAPGAGLAPPPPPAFLSNPQSTSQIPPPPPMGAPQGSSQLNETTGDAGRDALLASIRNSGGIGVLKKVDKSQLDKPSVILQEARGDAPPPSANSSNAAPGGGQGSLADALAAALNKRKTKVSNEDNYDNGDDW